MLKGRFAGLQGCNESRVFGVGQGGCMRLFLEIVGIAMMVVNSTAIAQEASQPG
jgi:hypothetical protein